MSVIDTKEDLFGFIDCNSMPGSNFARSVAIRRTRGNKNANGVANRQTQNKASLVKCAKVVELSTNFKTTVPDGLCSPLKPIHRKMSQARTSKSNLALLNKEQHHMAKYAELPTFSAHKRQRAGSISNDVTFTPNKRMLRSTSFTGTPIQLSRDGINSLLQSSLHFGWSSLSITSNNASPPKLYTRKRCNSPAVCKVLATPSAKINKEEPKAFSFRTIKFRKAKKDSVYERTLKRHASFTETKKFQCGSVKSERRKSFGDGDKRVGSIWLNISFSEVLSNKVLVALFRVFLKSEFSEENLDFWLECEDLKKCKKSKQGKCVTKIYEKYIAVGAPREVNVDENTRKLTKEKALLQQIDSFDVPQKHIFDLMCRDSFPRFILTKEFQTIMEIASTEKNKPRKDNKIKSSFRLKKPFIHRLL